MELNTPFIKKLHQLGFLRGSLRKRIEAKIATDAECSYCYALVVLKAPFPLGEPAIAKYDNWSYYYARNVLKAPFPLGEEAIAKDDQWSVDYAQDILHDPNYRSWRRRYLAKHGG